VDSSTITRLTDSGSQMILWLATAFTERSRVSASFTSTTAKIFIEDNTYWVGDTEDPDSPIWTGDITSPDRTGLVAIARGAVAITCGVHVGDIMVAVEVWQEPPAAELVSWDDAAEGSVVWESACVTLVGASVDGASEIEIALPPSPTGSYRVRAHVKNRDGGEDRDDEDPVEQHLLQIWAAPPAPEALLKATDEVGNLWRQPSG
jgi:hypothetical protein